MHPLRIFVGYDPREAVAYHTCVQSIIETARDPMGLSFTPVTGARRDGSNDFIYARFEIPWRCGYKGIALWLDGDMVVRAPIEDLFAHAKSHTGVSVVKHDYKTKHPVKYLGNKNEDYPRKQWSSVVVWNCGFMPNRILTPEFVARQSGSFLHRFQWLQNDQIGDIPREWNRLVLEEPLRDNDKLRHFTIGIPAFAEYADCDGAEEWWATLSRSQRPLVG